MRSRLRTIALSNGGSRLCSVVLAFIFTPFYISALGIEAYGIIGFYIALQASLVILELGLGRACTREIALSSRSEHRDFQHCRDTLRSLEVVYWSVAVILGVLLTAAAHWITGTWLNTTRYSVNELANIFGIIAIVIAVRWPVGLYLGALRGLQRQVPMNLTQIGLSVLNWAGSAAALWIIDLSLTVFFQWQLFVATCSVLIFFFLTWAVIPGQGLRGRFSLLLLKKISFYAAMVSANAIIGILIRNADKLILSALLPLKQFGYYVLASMISNLATTIGGPISDAIFPRMAQLSASEGNNSGVSKLYHLSSQAVGALVVPFSLMIAIFAPEVLQVYVPSLEVPTSLPLVLSLLVIAKLLHAYLLIPAAAHMAFGKMKPLLYVNLARLVIYLPLIYFMAKLYGLIGAAMAWLIVSLLYAIILAVTMHKDLLSGELKKWSLQSVLVPLAGVTAFLFSVHWGIGEFPSSRLAQLSILVVIGLGAMILATLLSSDLRTWFITIRPHTHRQQRRY